MSQTPTKSSFPVLSRPEVQGEIHWLSTLKTEAYSPECAILQSHVGDRYGRLSTRRVVIVSPGITSDGYVDVSNVTFLSGLPADRTDLFASERAYLLPLSPSNPHPDTGILLRLENAKIQFLKRPYIEIDTSHRVPYNSLRPFYGDGEGPPGPGSEQAKLNKQSTLILVQRHLRATCGVGDSLDPVAMLPLVGGREAACWLNPGMRWTRESGLQATQERLPFAGCCGHSGPPAESVQASHISANASASASNLSSVAISTSTSTSTSQPAPAEDAENATESSESFWPWEDYDNDAIGAASSSSPAFSPNSPPGLSTFGRSGRSDSIFESECGWSDRPPSPPFSPKLAIQAAVAIAPFADGVHNLPLNPWSPTVDEAASLSTPASSPVLPSATLKPPPGLTRWYWPAKEKEQEQTTFDIPHALRSLWGKTQEQPAPIVTLKTLKPVPTGPKNMQPIGSHLPSRYTTPSPQCASTSADLQCSAPSYSAAARDSKSQPTATVAAEAKLTALPPSPPLTPRQKGAGLGASTASHGVGKNGFPKKSQTRARVAHQLEVSLLDYAGSNAGRRGR